MILWVIVFLKEVGVIIGKVGKNVVDLCDEIGVKVGVSKVVFGVYDCVFIIIGGCEVIFKVYVKVVFVLMEGVFVMGMGGVVVVNGIYCMCFV